MRPQPVAAADTPGYKTTMVVILILAYIPDTYIQVRNNPGKAVENPS